MGGNRDSVMADRPLKTKPFYTTDLSKTLEKQI
jgi:hypothetical protein